MLVPTYSRKFKFGELPGNDCLSSCELLRFSTKCRVLGSVSDFGGELSNETPLNWATALRSAFACVPFWVGGGWKGKYLARSIAGIYAMGDAGPRGGDFGISLEGLLGGPSCRDRDPIATANFLGLAENDIR